MQSSGHSFDVDRYLGVWYEIAKVPFPYEQNCVFAKAEYSRVSPDEMPPQARGYPSMSAIRVKNTCLRENRMEKYSRYATAWIPDSRDKTKLRILFEGSPRDPEGDYWVEYTDYNQYAIVGGPSKQFLWILSRTPTVPKQDIPLLLAKVRSLGYDEEKLVSNSKLFY